MSSESRIPEANESPEGDAEPEPAPRGKYQSPPEATRPARGYVFRRSIREFTNDNSTDQAATLTYYAVLSIFPGLLALVSLPALFGQGQETTDALMGVIDDIAPASVADQLSGPVEQVSTTTAAGPLLIIGLVVAIWSASAYVAAFGRAMNRVYGVTEGRPFWKLRPIMLAITVLVMVLVLAAAAILVVSGPVATAIGDAVGAGDTALTVWNIAKWPVLALVVMFIVAILYWATPNVRQPKFRWLSLGAVIAILVWAAASAGFGFYVANFGSYDQTYGALAGVIIFLLWLWLTNLALLFGAEIDSELERVRELRAGEPAEENIQLPPRDTAKIDKSERKAAKLAQEGRGLNAHRPRHDS